MNDNLVYLILFNQAFLLLGFILGWIVLDQYKRTSHKERHEFETLFEENPHPEIYDENGKINRKTYLSVEFDTDDYPLVDPLDDDDEEKSII